MEKLLSEKIDGYLKEFLEEVNCANEDAVTGHISWKERNEKHRISKDIVTFRINMDIRVMIACSLVDLKKTKQIQDMKSAEDKFNEYL